MSRESTHLSNLVEDILVIPRLEAGRLRLDPIDVDLREAAYSVVDLVITADSHKEAFVAVPGGVIVKVDPVRIRQVLRNLLDNANKYSGPGRTEIRLRDVGGGRESWVALGKRPGVNFTHEIGQAIDAAIDAARTQKPKP